MYAWITIIVYLVICLAIEHKYVYKLKGHYADSYKGSYANSYTDSYTDSTVKQTVIQTVKQTVIQTVMQTVIQTFIQTAQLNRQLYRQLNRQLYRQLCKQLYRQLYRQHSHGKNNKFCSVFVSNLTTNTKSADVVSFLHKKHNRNFKIVPIPSKLNDCVSFKVVVPVEMKETMLDKGNWTKNVYLRAFFFKFPRAG